MVLTEQKKQEIREAYAAAREIQRILLTCEMHPRFGRPDPEYIRRRLADCRSGAAYRRLLNSLQEKMDASDERWTEHVEPNRMKPVGVRVADPQHDAAIPLRGTSGFRDWIAETPMKPAEIISLMDARGEYPVSRQYISKVRKAGTVVHMADHLAAKKGRRAA